MSSPDTAALARKLDGLTSARDPFDTVAGVLLRVVSRLDRIDRAIIELVRRCEQLEAAAQDGRGHKSGPYSRR